MQPGFSHIFIKISHVLFILLHTVTLRAQPAGDAWIKLDERTLLGESMLFYARNIRHADSVYVFARFDELIRTGKKHRNPALEAISYGMKASWLSGRKDTQSRNTESIMLYNRALELAEKKRLPVLSAYFEYELGRTYYFGNDYIKGIEYLFNAREHVREIGLINFPAAGPLCYALGTVYCDYGESHKSLDYLLQATRYPFADSHMLYRLYGMLGLVYYNLQTGDSSVYYGKQALAIAQALKDTVEIASMSGNIGAGYIISKEYDTALLYLQTDHHLSSSLGNWSSAAASLVFMARVYVQKGDPDKAIQFLDRADSIFSFCNCRADEAMRSVYNILSDIYKQKKDNSGTAISLDSFIHYDKIYQKKYNASILKSTELKVATEMHETRIQLLESERKRQVLLRNTLIIASVLTIIIIIQILYRVRQRQVSERKIFTLQLSNAQKQLTSYVDSIREKNRLMDQLREELEQVRFAHPEDPDNNSAEREKILARIRQASLITEEGWHEFTKLVDAVHKNFFIRLKEKYPDLTPADTRLLTLVKLNFSTGEMADMLGISPDSVKKSRQRVRKKIGISSEEDISDVVAQL